VPNISSYNINDVALYYHALKCVEELQDFTAVQERIRKRLVDYLERRRAALAFSRPVPGVRSDLAVCAGQPGVTSRVLGCLAQRADSTLRTLERAGR